MVAGLSQVTGGGIRAAESCAPAKAGAQTRVSAQSSLLAQGRTGPHGRWRLPAPLQPTLSEIFAASPRDSGWTGFLLPQLESARPLLWVQDRMAIREAGRVHPAGLPGVELIHVAARDGRDALWAMEEGLRCSGIGAVIGELYGDPLCLDFTATRRLAVAAERSQVPCWLVRLGGTANLSGARMRWRIASRPSLPHSFDFKAPGTPVWEAELFRARGSAPGTWAVAHEGHPSKWHFDGAREADRFHLLAASGDRALEPLRRRA